jgi:hypothetical protein
VLRKGDTLSEYPDYTPLEDPEDCDDLVNHEEREAGLFGDGCRGQADIPEGQDMLEYPEWRDGILVVPEVWQGQLSKIEFSIIHKPEGTILIAEIPGEITSTVSALCTDGDGLLDLSFAIDAAVSVASCPEEVPTEFLEAHSMALHFAAMIFEESGRKITESMDQVFRPPDNVEAHDLAKKFNDKISRSLREISKRLRATLTAKLPNDLNFACTEAAENRRSQH